MSETMVLGPIIAALVKSEDILGKNRKWNPGNAIQGKFLDEFFSKRNELAGFSKEELRSWASRIAAELNKILAEEGFNIRLQDFLPEEFGVVSILDVLVEWLKEGEKSQLRVNGADYSAVTMKPMAEIAGELKHVYEVFIPSGYAEPVAMLYTKSGDRVYMTVADGPAKGFELIAKIDQIRKCLDGGRYWHCDWLQFPTIDLNQKVDISWLIGMRTTDDKEQESVISQALQQTKFKMNEFGARVKSAVAIAVLKGMSQGLVIDKPFFLWIERKGMSIPLMYAYINEEDWKNPGNLSM